LAAAVVASVTSLAAQEALAAAERGARALATALTPQRTLAAVVVVLDHLAATVAMAVPASSSFLG
jgi:hypothetical protein